MMSNQIRIEHMMMIKNERFMEGEINLSLQESIRQRCNQIQNLQS
jgi:hypothetical protein